MENKPNIMHYIIVRRDLPFGVTLAQVAHAAAESTDGGHHHVCVLGIKNELRLHNLCVKIEQAGVDFRLITEPDAPWNNQYMAVGIKPGEKDDLAPIFTNLQTYREFEGEII